MLRGMNTPMPRTEKAKPRRYVAATNPNTAQFLVRLPPKMLAELDEVVRRLNDKAAASKGPTWSRSDVVRAILARRLDAKPADDDLP